jgi:hypothetical protein
MLKKIKRNLKKGVDVFVDYYHAEPARCIADVALGVALGTYIGDFILYADTCKQISDVRKDIADLAANEWQTSCFNSRYLSGLDTGLTELTKAVEEIKPGTYDRVKTAIHIDSLEKLNELSVFNF